jgi:UrcA family protein
MNRLSPHRPLLLPVFATALLAAAQASADRSPGAKVSYADLDLSKPAGAEALYHRIQAAARSACHRGRVDPRDIERFKLYRRCYGESVDTAVKQVDHAGLYAVHDAESGAPLRPGVASLRSTAQND